MAITPSTSIVESIEGAKRTNVNYSVSDLLARVQSLILECNYELAKQFADRSLELQPNNPEVLEANGAVEMELGNIDKAKHHLLKAIELCPTKGPNKYLQMGQITTALESISYYEKGVTLLNEELTLAQNLEVDAIRKRISSALCNMTELYLTDLCFEPSAEQKCEEYLTKAIRIDPSNPEPGQLLASVRLSQSRQEEAKSCLAESMKLWRGKYSLGDTQYPPFGTRVSLVRLLLEIGELEQADAIIEELQTEDDENVEVWYLAGWTGLLKATSPITGEKDMDILIESRECLKTCGKLMETLGCDDEGVRDHVSELLMQIEAEGLPPITYDDEEKSIHDGEDADWIDEDDKVDQDIEMQ